MSLEDCYEVCGGDLAAVRGRLLDDNRIAKYLGFFLQDDTYELLGTSMAQQDWPTAFRAAHTLKGTSMELGLLPLHNAAFALCEALRPDDAGVPKNLSAADELKQQVDDAYVITQAGIALP